MSSTPGWVSPAWLDQREPADAAARAVSLADELRRRLPNGDRIVVHDLGCGTGSMTRWLAPRLPGPQHWVLHDRDPDLLWRAAINVLGSAVADGTAVTFETRRHDLTELGVDDLAGASLITASALLDLLTADQVDRIVGASTTAGCPVLITLSVIGRVELTPYDPLDDAFGEAFNDHQRRPVDGARLLGPDAAAFTADAFSGAGADVLIRPNSWTLDTSNPDLTAAWLAGWIDAACEQRPVLAPAAGEYARRRAGDLSAGRLRVVVHHCDLLALP